MNISLRKDFLLMPKKLAALIIALILATFVFQFFGTKNIMNNEMSYSDFLKKVDEGEVDSVKIYPDSMEVKMIDGGKNYRVNVVEDDKLVEKLYSSGIDFERVQTSSILIILSNILISWGPTIVIVIIFVTFFSKQFGNVMNSGKVKDVSVDKNTGITFKDVAGQDEAKEQLHEIIDYLENPQKYAKIGARLPKGALLVGPPGTGKTLIAKAIAGEAKVPFFQMSGSDFIEMYAGVGASRVRDLFEKAEKQAPCIIFIDEVDTIAKNRNAGHNGGNDEREQTLNQLLSELDGFDSSKGIVVLAATNRPEVLDKAFLRTGRFDRKIIVDKPDFQGRLDTFKVHANKIKLSKNTDLTVLAKATAGAVGADIENILNEAALRAIRFNREEVTQEDLMDSIETVFAGKEKKTHLMSQKEKEIVSYHEVGHAVVATLQKGKSPVTKITIVPRTMGALGFTMQVPEEDKYLLSKEELLVEVTTLLAGRAAEEVFFSSITTGAANDLQRATESVRKMITMYGMSNVLGLATFESSKSAFLDDSIIRDCSEQTSAEIDKEVIAIIQNQYEYAKKLIKNNRDLINEIAVYLLQKESISGDEFMLIYNRYNTSQSQFVDSPVIEPLDSAFVSEPVVLLNKDNASKEKEIVKNSESKESDKSEQQSDNGDAFDDLLKKSPVKIKPEPISNNKNNNPTPSKNIFTPNKSRDQSKKQQQKTSEKPKESMFGPPSSKAQKKNEDNASKQNKKSENLFGENSTFTEDMY